MPEFLSEKEIIEFWRNIDAFKESLRLTEKYPKFNFYDGPPFATGLPHYGHIVASTIKDIIPRYKSQNGHHVERVFGWDTHGLPIEFEIEKLLNIKTKQEVIDFGIDNYNNECKKIVLKFRDEWRYTIERLGRWVDFENDYKTMDKSFMESIWWVFGELFKKNLIYRGVKVMPYSNGCTTPLSNFEATSNYKNVPDPSLTIKIKVKLNNLDFNPVCSMLVWTTTPWTLISNLALCVNPKLKYCIIHSKKDYEYYIIAKECLKNYFTEPENFDTVKIIDGSDLKGYEYNPIFSYFKYKYNGFRVLTDEYVESGSGTGIVHIAPSFGKDDYRVCIENNIITKDIQPPCPLNENGYFTDNITEFKNVYIKDADKLIIKNLKQRGKVFSYKSENHEYPYCWRSNTPLIYKSVPSWFVRVEEFKDKIYENNLKTQWVPSHIRDNKFGSWLKNSIDWCISRNRYWGTPIPIWTNEDFTEIVCVSSIKELEELAGLTPNSLNDIHRHKIDHITIPSKSGKGVLRRITEVFDCWFESGSMPYAQKGYPYNFDNIDDIFPADFIAEGTDQTRGWFYTLMVLSTALFDKPAFKNVIVNGLVLASDGEKMSKSKKNYPPVNGVFDKFGADAVRLYLVDGPVVKAGDLKFKESDIKTIVKNVNILMYNMVKYLVQMINLYESKLGNFELIDISKNMDKVSDPIDCWILEYTNKFVENVHRDLEKYELYHIVDRITNLIDKLSRWYVKLSKPRFNDNDQLALSVFHYCIYHTIITIAPFTPFMSEIIYQKIKKYTHGPKSVHFIQMKKVIWDRDSNLISPMESLFKIISGCRVIRTKKLKRELKMPVKDLIIVNSNHEKIDELSILQEIMLEELNVMNVKYDTNEKNYVSYKLTVNPKLGRLYREKVKVFNKYLSSLANSEIENIILEKKDVVINDQEIKFNDLQVLKQPKKIYDNYHTEVEDDFIVLMNSDVNDEINFRHQCKLMIRFLQDFRKECNLLPSDKISIYYRLNNDNNLSLIGDVIQESSKFIKTNIVYYNDDTTVVLSKTQIKDYNLLDNTLKIYYENLN